LPKFVDFKSDAATAAASGVAGAMSSASAMNYAKRQISSSAGYALSPTSNVCTDTTDWGTLVPGITFTTSTPSGNSSYQLTGTGNCASSGSGAVVSCTVTNANAGTATAQVTCP